MGSPRLTPHRDGTLAPVWRQAIPANVLRDEPMRRGVQRLVREQAALHGYRGRLRYRRLMPATIRGVSLAPRPLYLLEVNR